MCIRNLAAVMAMLGLEADHVKYYKKTIIGVEILKQSTSRVAAPMITKTLPFLDYFLTVLESNQRN